MSDEITILMPVWNRPEFLPLFLMNVKSQDYPHQKLKIIIDDDGDTPFISDINEVRRTLHPIPVQYITGKPRRTIGKKRNDLVKAADTKIVCFMDSDDLYLPTYISHSYELLKSKKVGCVGCDKMIFLMTSKDFSIHAIDCGDNRTMVHEATLLFTKKWFNSTCKFNTKNTGEGKNLFHGVQDKTVAISNIMKLMVCIEHDGNTINKLQFAKEENKVDLELRPEIIQVIKNVLKIN